MNMNANRDLILMIEGAFRTAIENKDVVSILPLLKNTTEKIFPSYSFTVDIVQPNIDEYFFGMSVTPETSTVEKIIDAIANKEPDPDVISSLWNSEKTWHIELDARLFDPAFSARLNAEEMTALYLHEIGHIIASNSVPTRLITILQYEVIKSSYSAKSMVRNKVFGRVLSIPILSACFIENSSKSAIREEINADKFVKKIGYQKHLISAFDKFIAASKKDAKSNKAAMKMTARFSIDSLEQFKDRKEALVEKNWLRMSNESSSPIMQNTLNGLLDNFFSTYTETGNRERCVSVHHIFIEKAEERYITEVFGFFKPKPLSRIDPTELDYIVVKTQAIFSQTDKMMLVAYIHNKLDIVEYYISILNDPKMSKKYSVPYTMQELVSLRTRLYKNIDDVINYKVGTKGQILVSWPENYEG